MSEAGAHLLQSYLERAAQRYPERTALVCAGEHLGFGELDARANAAGNALRRLGVVRGDRVFLVAENSLECAIAFWSILKADAVVTLVNPLTKASKLARLIADATPRVVIADAHLRRNWLQPCGAVATLVVLRGDPIHGSNEVGWESELACGDRRPVPHRNLDRDLAAITYTSGSTGEPKGVMLTHRNMRAASESVSTYLALSEGDVILNVLPFSFSYGLYQMITAVQCGARVPRARVRSAADRTRSPAGLPWAPRAPHGAGECGVLQSATEDVLGKDPQGGAQVIW